jgi:pimeloyl-ACP methyl ester carboxylesterase
MNALEVRRSVLSTRGLRLCVRDAGALDAPAVLLVHGLASDASTWDPVVAPLVRRGLRVVAPDLIGHGDSDKPLSGYTLESFSASLETVTTDLNLSDPTVVGHSFGGAIAMHYAQVTPHIVKRLVLVSSGGLGRRVHPILRAAALPGAARALSVVLNPALTKVYGRPALHRALRLRPELVANLNRTGRNLGRRDGRTAFFHTLRHVISTQGQRGSMIELELLDQSTPTLIVWAIRDPIIPVSHARDLHAHLPNSRLELFDGHTHEPHRRQPERFAEVLADFVRTT